ncbi:hypothetical protein QMK19_03490 [Streptomyces sp. H10-C2]|uniref:hypothetical protein n=1 Tax=unclassified Streptomyces TaxID=2593676 RepID=UPI0024BB43F9|nr:MULTISPECIES: hypothetical protein [unclassified Streptomyces]MDJ0342250.1 hypothetical protein [Streptomyces sp. PH10-H1]MDJ0368764.1 hypothetical protein [Streptomyces sp. H10-C2]
MEQRTLINRSVTVRGRWFRVAAFYGDAPGSHMGFWRTSTGTVRGWNYRVGKVKRCVTVLAHTRRA